METKDGLGLFEFLIKNFGPYGGLIILLLGVSLYALYKLAGKYGDALEKIAELHSACEKEKKDLEAKHFKEKIEFKEQCDKQLQAAMKEFLERDNQKRNDVIGCFAKFDAFAKEITQGLKEFSNMLIQWRLNSAR